MELTREGSVASDTEGCSQSNNENRLRRDLKRSPVSRMQRGTTNVPLESLSDSNLASSSRSPLIARVRTLPTRLQNPDLPSDKRNPALPPTQPREAELDESIDLEKELRGTYYDAGGGPSVESFGFSHASSYNSRASDFRKILSKAHPSERGKLVRVFRESYALHLLQEGSPSLVLCTLRTILDEREALRAIEPTLDFDFILKILRSGAMAQRGTDYRGRPIVWIRTSLLPQRTNGKTMEMIWTLSWIIDLGLRRREANIESMIFVIDEKAKPPLHFNLKLEMKLILSMMRGFPGIMYKVYVLSPGLAWKVSRRLHSTILPSRLLARIENVDDLRREEVILSIAATQRDVPSYISSTLGSDICTETDAIVDLMQRKADERTMEAKDVFSPRPFRFQPQPSPTIAGETSDTLSPLSPTDESGNIDEGYNYSGESLE